MSARNQFLDVDGTALLEGIHPETCRKRYRAGCYRGAKGGGKRGKNWRLSVHAYHAIRPEIPLEEIYAAANPEGGK